MFPGAPGGGAQTSNNGGGDAFVAKLNSNATAVMYFTFLGGTGLDFGSTIAVDALGDAYISGQTTSTGLATAGAAQTSFAGVTDGFAAELNPSGSAFSYVTYLGGNHENYLRGLALDGSGNVYLTGSTDSANFPTCHRSSRCRLETGSLCIAAPIQAGRGPLSTRTFPAPSLIYRLIPRVTPRGLMKGVFIGQRTGRIVDSTTCTIASENPHLGRSPAAPELYTLRPAAAAYSGLRTTALPGAPWEAPRVGSGYYGRPSDSYYRISLWLQPPLCFQVHGWRSNLEFRSERMQGGTQVGAMAARRTDRFMRVLRTPAFTEHQSRRYMGCRKHQTPFERELRARTL